MFPSTAQLLDHLSKICVTFFDQMANDVKVMFTFKKKTSSGRAESQNNKNLARSTILNFSSFTRGHFSAYFDIFGHLVKEGHTEF